KQEQEKDTVEQRKLYNILFTLFNNLCGSVKTNMITAKRFGEFCSWFGPPDTHLFPRIMKYFNCFGRFFHGECPTARDLLDDGSFLLRFSSSTRGAFALSYLKQ